MLNAEVEFGTTDELTANMVRAQLERLVRDDAFRSSKRSVAFLRYVVERTLAGSTDQIKERTVGVEVFGRNPSYDTNTDHIVRTAAAELRKRLAAYYVDEKHRTELRMGLVPGSYVPRFTLPRQVNGDAPEMPVDGLGTRLLSGPLTAPAPAVLPLPAEQKPDVKAVETSAHWTWIIAIGAIVTVGLAAGFNLFHR